MVWAAVEVAASKELPSRDHALHSLIILRPAVEPVHYVDDPLMTIAMPPVSHPAFFSHDTERTVRDWLADNAQWPLSTKKGERLEEVPKLKAVTDLGYKEYVRLRTDEEWNASHGRTSV